MTYQITDQNIFNEKVFKVYIDVNNSGYGNVLIATNDGQNIEQDGEFGAHDFEEQFGFILIKD